VQTSLAAVSLVSFANVENLSFVGTGNFAGTGNGGDNLSRVVRATTSSTVQAATTP